MTSDSGGFQIGWNIALYLQALQTLDHFCLRSVFCHWRFALAWKCARADWSQVVEHGGCWEWPGNSTKVNIWSVLCSYELSMSLYISNMAQQFVSNVYVVANQQSRVLMRAELITHSIIKTHLECGIDLLFQFQMQLNRQKILIHLNWHDAALITVIFVSVRHAFSRQKSSYLKCSQNIRVQHLFRQMISHL